MVQKYLANFYKNILWVVSCQVLLSSSATSYSIVSQESLSRALGQKQFVLLYWVLDGDKVELVTLDVGVDGGGGEVGWGHVGQDSDRAAEVAVGQRLSDDLDSAARQGGQGVEVDLKTGIMLETGFYSKDIALTSCEGSRGSMSMLLMLSRLSLKEVVKESRRSTPGPPALKQVTLRLPINGISQNKTKQNKIK